MHRRRVAQIAAGGCAVLALITVLVLSHAQGGSPPYSVQTALVEGTREPDDVPVTLDADLYLPARTPAPAVLLSPGWGGDKDSVAADARYYAERGFVVLAYTPRGFGDSDGLVHLDSPQYEVKDGERMLDYLAHVPQVEQDGPNDPRVGVVGASYGGALALELAGADPRVDADVPSITWNDLRQALFPQFVTSGAQVSAAGLRPAGGTGVFKKQWTALLLGDSAASGAAAPDLAPQTPDPTATPADPASQQQNQALGLATLKAACGKIAADLCLGYLQAATTGRPTTALLNLLAASSPARTDSRITAPTLLIQGQTDSLFPLSEADANARAIAAAGTPVQLVWEAGGHDGGLNQSAELRALTADFLDRTLGPPGTHDPAQRRSLTGADFRVTVPDALVSSTDSNPAPQSRSAEHYPGIPLGGSSADPTLSIARLALHGGRQLAISPPGATPSALTDLPGAGSALSLLGSASTGSSGFSGSSGLNLGVLPGQSAGFETDPLTHPITITGSSRVTVRITSTTTDATLFASLQDVGPDGSATLPQALVSPIRISPVPAAGQLVTIALPAILRDVPAGHRLRVVLSSTDQAYAVPVDARGYEISLAGDDALSVPEVPLTVQATNSSRQLWTAAAVLAVIALLIMLGFGLHHRRERRQTDRDVDAELLEVPLAIAGLGKAYGDGFRAVSDLTFRVEKGQVLGLLGPNGAGKTTTLRMLMGLILPTEGTIRIFGHQVRPGAAVLSRLGSFIEGPGFLPHLSGRENLEFYWQATGRRGSESGLDVALEIAGLGRDLERKVRTYSQGMRQRLAIAQAMLGLPELLVLDEPTNGLDPPQIAEMREVLRRYAATGRTVVISSHLLAEVEQTCSHLVVMLNGRLVAEGPVQEVTGADDTVVVEVDDPARAVRIAALVKGLGEVEVTDAGLVVQASPAIRALLIRALVLADVRVEKITPKRGLEETFLALVEAG